VESLLEDDDTLSENAREQLTVVGRAVADVADTVARMRLFYRPREAELVLKPVDLNLLLRQVVELTRARWKNMAQEHGIMIELDSVLAPDLLPIAGIETELRDALTNLVLNAVDAMPKGGTLRLRSRLGQAAGHNGATAVVIEVSDSGIGMSEETRSRCLEPFFTTKGDRGTGLGLAMVYATMQRHNAELELESELGHGTTIRLSFPAAAVKDLEQSAVVVRVQRSLRILVVDDDPLLLQSLRDVLTSDGHQVTAADGGQNGIREFLAAQARAEPYALVITDLGMPKVDGRAVAAAIKASAPRTPVILLTGWGQRLHGEGEPFEHMDRVLSKPPRLVELRAALSDLSDRSSAS
jgi:CheY-like chemotaxis protein/anti-sigma regulatory factor (Ser/Thr protein kinase)